MRLVARRRHLSASEIDQVGELERTILAAENPQCGSSACRLVGSNLPQSSCHGLTSIRIRFASSQGSPTRLRRADLEAGQLDFSIQTDIKVVELDRAPLDRSSLAMTWERAQFVGATRTMRTQSSGGVSSTPTGIINPSQQNRRCFMGIPPRSRG